MTDFTIDDIAAAGVDEPEPTPADSGVTTTVASDETTWRRELTLTVTGAEDLTLRVPAVGRIRPDLISLSWTHQGFRSVKIEGWMRNGRRACDYFGNGLTLKLHQLPEWATAILAEHAPEATT